MQSSVISPSEEDSTTFIIHTHENELFKLRGKVQNNYTIRYCLNGFSKINWGVLSLKRNLQVDV